jgi:hypothetical protein
VFNSPAKLRAVPPVPVMVPVLKTSELPPRLMAVEPDTVPELVTVPLAALMPKLLPDSVPEFDMSATVLADTANAPPEMNPELVREVVPVVLMPRPPAATRIVPEFVTVAVVARIPNVPPEMAPELFTVATFALMPNMLPDIVPKLLVTLDALALMLMPPDMVPKLMILAALVALMPNTPPEMIPKLVTLAVSAALMPNKLPEIVPVPVLVTVSVALSKMPLAPPERNIALVHVWLVPAVVHGAARAASPTAVIASTPAPARAGKKGTRRRANGQMAKVLTLLTLARCAPPLLTKYRSRRKRGAKMALVADLEVRFRAGRVRRRLSQFGVIFSPHAATHAYRQSLDQTPSPTRVRPKDCNPIPVSFFAGSVRRWYVRSIRMHADIVSRVETPIHGPGAGTK